MTYKKVQYELCMLKDNQKQKLLRALQEIVINSIYPINAIQATKLLNDRLKF